LYSQQNFPNVERVKGKSSNDIDLFLLRIIVPVAVSGAVKEFDQVAKTVEGGFLRAFDMFDRAKDVAGFVLIASEDTHDVAFLHTHLR